MKVENQIGRCQPVVAVYNGLYAALCSALVDGMVCIELLWNSIIGIIIIQNGFWCSILWCVCACVCLIIAGTTITIFFRKSDDQE